MSAGKKSVQTRDTREIARSASNDASKTRNKPLCDTRNLIARVSQKRDTRDLFRACHTFFVSVMLYAERFYSLNALIPRTRFLAQHFWVG